MNTQCESIWEGCTADDIEQKRICPICHCYLDKGHVGLHISPSGYAWSDDQQLVTDP